MPVAGVQRFKPLNLETLVDCSSAFAIKMSDIQGNSQHRYLYFSPKGHIWFSCFDFWSRRQKNENFVCLGCPHKHLSNIGLLMAVPPALFASLVLLMAAAKKMPWKTDASSGHTTNLKQSMLDFRYLWLSPRIQNKLCLDICVLKCLDVLSKHCPQ